MITSRSARLSALCLVVFLGSAACEAGSQRGAESSARRTPAPAASSSSSPARASASAPQAVPSQVAVRSAPAGAPRVLDIDADTLQVDESDGTVTWVQDGNVKRGDYDRFRFEYENYVAVVGLANLRRSVKLQAECGAPTIERGLRATSPIAQQPVDGFEHRTHPCRAIAATIE